MKNPIISTIIPIAGPHKYIQNLTYLFENEDFRGVEVILVHDTFDGKESTILEDLRTQFPKIQITLIVGNFGSPGEARNVGLSVASGEWIIFCDADDRIFLETIKLIIPRVNDGDLIVGQFKRCDLRGNLSPSSRTHSLKNLWFDPGFWRITYKRSQIADIRFCNLKMGEDIVFLADVLRTFPKIIFSNNTLYEYRVGNPMQSTSNPKNISQLNLAINEIMNRNPNWRKNKNDSGLLMRMATSQLIGSLRAKNLDETISSFHVIVCKPHLFISMAKSRIFRNA